LETTKLQSMEPVGFDSPILLNRLSMVLGGLRPLNPHLAKGLLSLGGVLRPPSTPLLLEALRSRTCCFVYYPINKYNNNFKYFFGDVINFHLFLLTSLQRHQIDHIIDHFIAKFHIFFNINFYFFLIFFWYLRIPFLFFSFFLLLSFYFRFLFFSLFFNVFFFFF